MADLGRKNEVLTATTRQTRNRIKTNTRMIRTAAKIAHFNSKTGTTKEISESSDAYDPNQTNPEESLRRQPVIFRYTDYMHLISMRKHYRRLRQMQMLPETRRKMTIKHDKVDGAEQLLPVIANQPNPTSQVAKPGIAIPVSQNLTSLPEKTRANTEVSLLIRESEARCSFVQIPIKISPVKSEKMPNDHGKSCATQNRLGSGESCGVMHESIFSFPLILCH